MPSATATSTPLPKEEQMAPTWRADEKEREAGNIATTDFLVGRNVIDKEYNQFNGRNLYNSIDDWTKRWNGFVPPANPLLDRDQSRMFLNFTRNQVISYLAKVALQRVKAKIKAVEKKTGLNDLRLSQLLEDLNTFSLDAENGDARYLEAAFEACVKGTVIVYEGYRRETHMMKSPMRFNAENGELEWKEEERVIFDNAYQEVVPLEDFFIANPYQPDVQKQPFVIWRKITTYDEAYTEFGNYKNWKYVQKGGGPGGSVAGTATTFYRNRLFTDISENQCEILRYYNRKKNLFVLLVNGITLYQGPIPRKDGRYPFAKGIFEPFDNFFFWGAGFPNKIMGEQDLMNTFWNMMSDKTFASLLPYGLSSDLDDMIEDDVLQPNKIRKVGDINKWKFDNLPGVTAGEVNMLQQTMSFARENSGDMSGAGNASTPKGGKITARQALLQQQESMQRLGFSMNFLEDFERDRTILRLGTILQFYSIPKIKKITGETGEAVEQLLYRDVRLNGVMLEDGRQGTRLIKLTGTPKTPDERAQIADQLSVMEEVGEAKGEPMEAVAIDINTFQDFNLEVQVVRRSSYERNQVLDQAARHEYANWRIAATQFGVPVNAKELVKWVDESYDIDSERFDAPEAPPGAPGMPPGVPGAPQQPGQPPQQSQPSPMPQVKPQMPDTMGSEI